MKFIVRVVLAFLLFLALVAALLMAWLDPTVSLPEAFLRLWWAWLSILLVALYRTYFRRWRQRGKQPAE